MTKSSLLLLTSALVSFACSDSDSDSNADASPDRPDAVRSVDAAAVPDAVSRADAPPADLSDHGFVDVDGAQIDFDDTWTYTNISGISDVTILGEIGPDCPIGNGCMTLYVTVPGDASLGAHNCDELGVSVQLNTEGQRYFGFGSAAAFCSFVLTDFGTAPGGQVAVSNISARLEANLNPGDNHLLSNGELRATTAN